MTAYDFLLLDASARVTLAYFLVAIVCLLGGAVVEERRQKREDAKRDVLRSRRLKFSIEGSVRL